MTELTGVLPPDRLPQQETGDKLQQAFHGLPAKLRVAATLALIEERPYGETDALEISLAQSSCASCSLWFCRLCLPKAAVPVKSMIPR
jgi:hypothetical protein